MRRVAERAAATGSLRPRSTGFAEPATRPRSVVARAISRQDRAEAVGVEELLYSLRDSRRRHGGAGEHQIRAICNMDRDRLLGAVSAAQLATGVAGMALALNRRHPYDLPLLHGRPETVARDSVIMGTALSAPIYMLVAQGVVTGRLLSAATAPSRLVLGGLGAAMVLGYFGEALVRRRLHRSSYDPLESPLVAMAISLSGAMAALGFTSLHHSS